jgi:DNA-binding LacI/PurR family transcriptional regulator
VYAAAGRPNGVTAWVEETHTVGRGFHDSARRLYDTTILTETYEQWKSRVPRHFAARMDSAVNNVVWGAFIDGEIYRQMDVFFTEALAQGSLTAWVCANDFIASLAADFLAHHKIRVPEDISIIGFDDSPEATRLGLTSYDFNIPGLVRSIIGCILRPSAFATYWREDRVAPEGFIVIRDSCASAAKQGRPPQAHQSAVIDSSAAATYGSIDAHDQR